VDIYKLLSLCTDCWSTEILCGVEAWSHFHIFGEECTVESTARTLLMSPGGRYSPHCCIILQSVFTSSIRCIQVFWAMARNCLVSGSGRWPAPFAWPNQLYLYLIVCSIPITNYQMYLIVCSSPSSAASNVRPNQVAPCHVVSYH
jgi:hypothetical protein